MITSRCQWHWEPYSIVILFIDNLNSRSRSLYAVARPSVVCLSVVCNVRAPIQPVEILGNVSTAFGTMAIH